MWYVLRRELNNQYFLKKTSKQNKTEEVLSIFSVFSFLTGHVIFFNCIF